MSANVYAYPTPNEGILTKAQRNPEMFCAVLDYVRPSVILVHGKKSIKQLIAILRPTNLINRKNLDTWLTSQGNIQVICARHLSRISELALMANRSDLLRLIDLNAY